MKKRRLFIISAGSLGRELETYMGMIPENDRDWAIAGYLHSGEDILSPYPSDYKILGDWKDFRFLPGDLVVFGVSDIVWKHRMVEALHGKVEFLTLVSPGALIGKFVRLGEGVVICPRVILTNHVTVGDFAVVNCCSTIGHDAVIGAFSNIMVSVDIGGKARIGRDVLMGTKSVLAPGKTIGDRCRIAAGAVVMRHVGAGKTMFGNPAVEM